MKPTKIIQINCRFCGTKTGELTVPVERSGNASDHGVEDSRCTECQEQFGYFPQISEFVRTHIEKDPVKANKILKDGGYKTPNILENIASKNSEKMFSVGLEAFDDVKKFRDSMEEDLGIASFGKEAKGRVFGLAKKEKLDLKKMSVKERSSLRARAVKGKPKKKNA